MEQRLNKYRSSVTKVVQLPDDLYQWLLLKAKKNNYTLNDFMVAHFEQVQAMEESNKK